VLVCTHAFEINTDQLPTQYLEQVTDPYELAKLGYPGALVEPDELLSKRSYPCLFRLDNSFYDFTPFKLASNVWPAYWINQTLTPISLPDSYQYEFSFCLLMNEANNATCNTRSYAIGSDLDGAEFLLNKDPAAQPPIQCQPYSGDSA